jgi:SAM-dependent methyltransferase
MDKIQITEAVKERYGSIARGERNGCGCRPTEAIPAIGYTAEDLAAAGAANLGLGCGNPLALAGIEPGMTVLDLGSGAGFDALLAWRKVGPTGRVIGVDMTDDMLALARQNAERMGAANVEFRKGSIERLPVEDASVDLVISNCVINLSPDKPAVFREMHRALKPGGRFAVSDIVLLQPLPESIGRDLEAYVGCVAGASLLSDYLGMALAAGFTELSLPQITDGCSLAAGLFANDASSLPGLATDHSRDALDAAVRSVVSAKLHGRKAGTAKAAKTAGTSCCGPA